MFPAMCVVSITSEPFSPIITIAAGLKPINTSRIEEIILVALLGVLAKSQIVDLLAVKINDYSCSFFLS